MVGDNADVCQTRSAAIQPIAHQDVSVFEHVGSQTEADRAETRILIRSAVICTAQTLIAASYKLNVANTAGTFHLGAKVRIEQGALYLDRFARGVNLPCHNDDLDMGCGFP